MNKKNKTCESCKYLKIGGVNDNYRFACVCPNVADVYLTKLTPACERYEQDLNKACVCVKE